MNGLYDNGGTSGCKNSSRGVIAFSLSKYIYIYVYMYIYMCCGVIIWATFWGFPKLLSGPSQCYYLGQVGFRTIKIGVSGDFFFAQLSFCVFFVSSYLLIFLKIAFFRKREQKLGFPNFSVLS